MCSVTTAYRWVKWLTQRWKGWSGHALLEKELCNVIEGVFRLYLDVQLKPWDSHWKILAFKVYVCKGWSDNWMFCCPADPSACPTPTLGGSLAHWEPWSPAQEIWHPLLISQAPAHMWAHTYADTDTWNTLKCKNKYIWRLYQVKNAWWESVLLPVLLNPRPCLVPSRVLFALPTLYTGAN